MHNTCMNSTISLRTRGTLSFSFNDYTHCSFERSPFSYPSSAASCCCCFCASSFYKLPIGSTYYYNLYGLRQSSLIQWSPCRKLISGGLDRLYSARSRACDVDFSCYCDKFVRNGQIRVGGREGGMRKCVIFEESESYEIGDVDEAEVLLSLLVEDVSEACLLATKETRRLVRKSVVEERENGQVSKKCQGKKKRVDLGVLESQPSYRLGSGVSSGKTDDRRREEAIRRYQEKEGLPRQENQKARLKEEYADALLTKQTRRKKGESMALLEKASQKDNEEKERKSKLREEDWKVTSRTEEREDLLRKEEQRQKVRKEGSSCSSYYSLSSTGDYESDHDFEFREGRFLEESLCSEKKNSKSNGMVGQEVRKEEKHRQEDYKEDHGITSTKKSTQNLNMVGSSVVESGFRKKSEKKLADVSVQELEMREEASQKESKLSLERESNYKKSSDYYVSYDDRQESTRFDEERAEQHGQTGNEVSRQSETRMKHKQFVKMQEYHDDDIINSYGSQYMHSGKGEMSSKIASSSQETVGAHQRVVGLSTREDESQRTSFQVAKVSEVQDIDNRKTSISHQSFGTSVKEEDYSTSIHSSISDVAEQKQHDQVRVLVESRDRTQQLTKKEGKSILKKVSDKRVTQEKNVNLPHGSSSSSEYKIMKRDNLKKGYDESTKLSLTHTGDSGEIDTEDRNRSKLEIQVGIASKLPETDALTQRSTSRIAATETGDGTLQVVSTPSHGQKLEISPELHHTTYGEANSSSNQEQPSKFVSPEGTIASAALLEKSSTQYVGEFINQVREEILSSEIQEKKTKFVQEEQLHQHDLVQHSSGDSGSKDHESRTDSRQSGTKGPSDEMWNVDEPSVQKASRTEVHDDASKAGKGIDKRTGRSLWNIISDIALLRWSSRSESHSSDKKTVERGSPNQSTSSETWFSGHEAAENEEVTEEKEQRTITLGLSGSNQEDISHSRVEEGSSSSTFEGHIKHAGKNVPSSSDAIESQPMRTSLHLGVITEGFSTTTMAKSSLPFRLQRSPTVHSEAEEAKASDSGRRERLNTRLTGKTESSVVEAEETKASDSGKREKLNTGLKVKNESTVDEGELRRRKLQRQDQVLKDRFDEWDNAYKLDAEQWKIDEKFMREALLEAQNAADNWEVPVGAVLVHDGKIVARGYNRVEELRDSTAHAEMICIREASSMLRTWRLSETTLYVTLEPCPMCAGAILQARIDTVVWGAPNKLLGADGSWIRLFPDGDGGNALELSNKPPAPVHPFHPKIVVRRGVLSSECADAMQQFFKLRRKDKKHDPSPAPPAGAGPPVSHRPFKFLTKMHDAFNLMFCL